MLGSNSFITIMKLEIKWPMKLWKMCSNKYQQWNPNHLVTIKNTSFYRQILSVRGTWHRAAWDISYVNQKTQKHLTMRGNLFFVCNLIDVRKSVAFNGIKWVVTHQWMSSVFEMLFLFWFLVMYLLSSWDEMDVHVELLADDVWEAEDDITGSLSVGVDIFDRLYLYKTIIW